jgi:hypothetical protein
MKLPMHDQNGQPSGEFEIPDEIIKAAYLVNGFLANTPQVVSLCGLYIKVGSINVEIKI